MAQSANGSDTVLTLPGTAASGLIINASDDDSVTNLGTVDPSIMAGYDFAADTAIQLFETDIVNSVTDNINL
jgi:hypothetical protein